MFIIFLSYPLLQQAYVHQFSEKLFLLIYAVVGLSLFIANAFIFSNDSFGVTKEIDEKSALTKTSDSDSDVGETETEKIPRFREVLLSARFGFFLFNFAALYLIFYVLVSGHNVIISNIFHSLKAGE